MEWPWIVLIVYGGIGFLLGVFTAIIDWHGGGIIYIIVLPFIGVPLLIIGAFQWLLDR